MFKYIIQDNEGIPSEKELDYNKNKSNYTIQKDSTIHLVLIIIAYLLYK